MEKNNATVTRAWCFYDWANSVYSLVIISTIFPIYYGAVANAGGNNVVSFFGWQLDSSVLFSYCISFSYLLVAATSPILTAIADYSGRKKLFMQLFCYLGSISCALLFFFTKETFTASVILFVLAAMGYNGSIVFYNSYLPDIATADRYDQLSARGFAWGYIGSVLLLIFNLALVLQPAWFGIDPQNTSLPPRISFLLTGVWWLGFAQYTFRHLPTRVPGAKSEGSWLFNGFRELKKVWQQVKKMYLLKRFLLAFFFYNMGVQTVMYVAAVFGDKELHLASGKLIFTILILQLVAIAGAYGFARLSRAYGNFTALIVAVMIWVGICLGAYYTYSEIQFYLLAAGVGIVMGGIQSLSRSTYSKLIPADTRETTQFFSFYDVTDKMAIVIGTLAYGVIAQATGTMRTSVLALMGFFFIGLILLLTIKGKRSVVSKVAA